MIFPRLIAPWRMLWARQSVVERHDSGLLLCLKTDVPPAGEARASGRQPKNHHRSAAMADRLEDSSVTACAIPIAREV